MNTSKLLNVLNLNDTAEALSFYKMLAMVVVPVAIVATAAFTIVWTPDGNSAQTSHGLSVSGVNART